MSRKQDRAHVMKLVFQLEYECDPSKIMKEYFDSFLDAEEDSPKETEHESIEHKFIEKEFNGVVSDLTEIDRIIAENTSKWQIKRISKADLAILRVAIFEMLFNDDVPPGVAVNEAVELAKIYSSDDAPAFINGVLGRIYDVYAKKQT